MRDDIITALIQMTEATFGAVAPCPPAPPARAAHGLIAPEAHAALLLALTERSRAPRKAA